MAALVSKKLVKNNMQKTYISPGTVSSPYKQNLLNIQKWQLYASKSDSIKILRLGAGKV